MRVVLPIAAALGLLLLGPGCGSPPPPDDGATQPEEALPPTPLDTGRQLVSEGSFGEAAEEFARVAERAGAAGDEETRWEARLQRARALFRIPRKDEAFVTIEAVQQAAGDDPAREVRAAYYHAAFLHQSGRLEEARVQATRSRDWATPVTDPDLVQSGYGILATVHSLMGNYEEALAINEELVRHFREVDPDPLNLARCLNEVGIDYRHFGRLDDARVAYTEALVTLRRERDERWLAIVLYNLANIYTSYGESDRSLALLYESLELAEARRDSYGLGLVHDSIGKTYQHAGNPTKAREHMEQALRINREAGQPYGELASLIGLAKLELQLAEPDTNRSRSLLVEAVELADRTGYGFQAADARIAMALVEVAAGRPVEALPWIEQGLARATELEDPDLEIQAIEAHARVLDALGQAAEAAERFEAAISLLESWRGRLAIGDLRMGLSDPRIGLFEAAIANLVRQQRPAEAFAIAERAKARLLLELMADHRGRMDDDDPRSRLLRRLKERYQTLRKARSESAARQASREIDALIAEVEVLESSEYRRDPVTSASRLPRPVSAGEAQEALVSDGRALISFFWGERHVFGWWIGPDGIRGSNLGAVESLAPAVEFLRAAVDSADSPVDWRPVAKKVYRELIAPLSPTSARDLFVVADGPLHRIPFEVLIAESDAPLALSHRIVYGPSASVLAAQARPADSDSRRFERAVLALGAPVVDRELLDAAERDGAVLAPLPHSKDEARFIADLYRDEGTELLLSGRATLDRWLAAGPQDFRFLHFATHAVVSDRAPEGTYLVLTHGALDLATIRRQRLHADLVTLSACESAIGKQVRGEGIVGLPHAFLAAGARGAVVALWTIRDESAADFMKDFYRNLHAGQPTAEALRLVRADWLAGDGQRSHPSSWAAFVQIAGSRLDPAP